MVDLDARVKENHVIYGENLEASFISLEIEFANALSKGVNTGFGGSADTRTKKLRKIQYGLIRELHSCVVAAPSLVSSDGYQPKSNNAPNSNELPVGSASSQEREDMKSILGRALPLEDPLTSNQMPESWSRAILLIRLNSLLGGQSAARPAILAGLAAMLNENVTPVIPLRGTVSASGDLAPLAYVAGCLLGKRTSYVWAGNDHNRHIERADIALKKAGLEPITLEKKEGLAIVNGTSASTGVGALATYEANYLVVVAQILTAMSVEALNGTDESFQPYIAEVRPHRGQVSTFGLRRPNLYIYSSSLSD